MKKKYRFIKTEIYEEEFDFRNFPEDITDAGMRYEPDARNNKLENLGYNMSYDAGLYDLDDDENYQSFKKLYGIKHLGINYKIQELDKNDNAIKGSEFYYD